MPQSSTVLLVALPALRRLAIGEDGSAPPLHLASGASHGYGVGDLLLLLLLTILMIVRKICQGLN